MPALRSPSIWATGLACALAVLCTALNAGCPDRADPPPAELPTAPPAPTRSGGAPLSGVPQAPLTYIPLIISGKVIQVEVADDEGERNRGLMMRRALSPDQGMLFVYPAERNLSFWMKDTLIPLSIAYINRDGVIISIRDMQPRDLRSVSSDGLARFALEMDQGWFAQNNVLVGATIEGLPIEPAE